MPEIEIAPLNDSPAIRGALSEILVEVVANGGSVGFMHPLAPEVAEAFWERSLAAAPGANGSCWAPSTAATWSGR